jgi:sugar phosphate isomerase/epimerase
VTAKVGLMLYTLRRECDDDLERTLGAVADLGYEGVELFSLHGREPELVRRSLDRLGLVAAGRHAGLDELEARLPELARELAILGTDRVAISWIEPPRARDDAQALVERIAAVADRAQRLDLRLGFHNHASELRPLDGNGDTFLGLLRRLPPELLWLELDLGWAWEAGVDPAELLLRTAGRCPLVHVKDFRSRGGTAHCPVGDGAVGYERVLPAAVSAGVEWLLVEQDETDGLGFRAVARSFGAVRRILADAA